MTTEERLAAEMRATADALEIVAYRIDRFGRAGHPVVFRAQESSVILAGAPPLVEALRALAIQLSEEA